VVSPSHPGIRGIPVLAGPDRTSNWSKTTAPKGRSRSEVATDVKRRFEILSSYRQGGRLEPERLVDRGDEVLFLGRLYVRSVRGGPEIGQSVNVLHTLLDGKIFLREAVTSRARHVARASCANPKRDRTLPNPGRGHDRQDLARCHRERLERATRSHAAWPILSQRPGDRRQSLRRAGRARSTPPATARPGSTFRAAARGGRGGSHGRLRADDARISASRPFA
jgi:hypothetical protein